MLYLRNRAYFDPLWSAGLSFPLSWVIPHVRASAISAHHVSRVHGLENGELSDQLDEALGVLQTRLDASRFLTGDRPLDADALVYALLAIPLAVQLPDETLYLALQRFPAVVLFVRNFQRDVFGVEMRTKEPTTPARSHAAPGTPSRHTPSRSSAKRR